MSLKTSVQQLWGGKRVPAVTPGTVAPPFSLRDIDGKPISLADALNNGPALIAFFKVSCPTCQLALPFVQRLYETYGGSNVTVLGVSQDGATPTRAFMQKFGIGFSVLLDDQGYAASQAYGLTNVPSFFWIRPDGKVPIRSVGFSKGDLETIAGEAAISTGKAAQPLFHPGEKVPPFKPG